MAYGIRGGLLSALAAGLAFSGTTLAAEGLQVQSHPTHSIMHPDAQTRERWREQLKRLPRFTPIYRLSANGVGAPTSANFLNLVSTQGPLRNQGACGDCWTWASGAMTEVALATTYGVRDQISNQYLNSNSLHSVLNSWACNGGSLTDFCAFYNQAGILVPTANANASYADGRVNAYCQDSLTRPADIQTAPAYTHVHLTPSLVPTKGVGQATAIANIKACLDQNLAVGFSFYTDFSGSNGFDAWWDGNDESAIWAGASTGAYDDASWGGHMITIVGYDESDPDPAKHYWIVLNSWGVDPTSRPHGLLRMSMQLNYDSQYSYQGSKYDSYAFETVAVSMDAPSASPLTAALPVPVVQQRAGQPLVLAPIVTGKMPFSYQWLRDGQPINNAGTSATYALPYLSAADAGSQIQVTVTDGTGASVTSAPLTLAPLGQQLLADGGFEDGASPIAWAWTGATASGWTSPFHNVPTSTHSGTWYGYLGATGGKNAGHLDQTLAIPSGTGSAWLSYWVRGNTSESGAQSLSTLSATVLDDQGQPLKRLRSYANTETDHLGWTLQTFDVSDLQGRTVTLRFDWTENPTRGNYSFWALDDLALTTVPASPSTASLDANHDGVVDVLDMAVISKAYGSRVGDAAYDAAADLDGNGVVDDADTAIFLNRF